MPLLRRRASDWLLSANAEMTPTIRRRNSLVFALPVLCAGVLACAGLVPARASDSGQPAKATLRVSGLPSADSTDPVGVANLRILEHFLEANPHIQVQPAEGIRLENMVSEVTTVMMIAGGIAPDVIQMNFRSMDTFVSKGMIAPLDEFLERETPEEREAILARVPPQVVPVINRVGPFGERHVFGLPSHFNFTGLYFNRDVFRRAGLPMRAPENWEEMREFARRIKETQPNSRPIFLAGGMNASWNLLSFIWSAGGDVVAEVGPDEWKAVFDSPEAVEAYAFYYELLEIENLVVRSGGTSLPQELARTGMLFGYVGDSIHFDPAKFGFGPVPKGPTGLRGSEINARVLGIFSQIEDPAVRDAAWEYIKFMGSEEAEEIKVNTLIEMGLANQVNPVLLRRFGHEAYLRLVPEGLEEAFAEALETGHPEPYGRNCNLVYIEMTYPLDQILLNREIRQLWLGGEIEAAKEMMTGILQRAVVKTNERMLGFVPPEEMSFRRIVAVVVVVLIFAGFMWVGIHVWKVFSHAGRMTSQPVVSKGILPWICLAPAAVLVLMWNYIPLARGTTMAFQDYQLILPSTFVGLDNFANVLFDSAFWNSLVATLHYAAWTLTVGFVAPITLAYALHLIPRHKILYRVLYYLPAMVSAAAVFFLWRELFGADSILNEILRFFGFEARRAWTEDPHLAMLSCVIPGIWAGVGPGCLIYLAALKTIPIEQFEAAEIDGASFFDKTRLIVFPGLKGLIIINFTGAVAAAFHGATNILIMTGGGPNGATEVTSLLLFFEAFTRLRFGHATAMAWIIGSMLIGITVLQLQRLSRMEFKTAK
jgi:ABC-type sugar transport system permease subunit/ABC-type glycerol-3-phosphate transport system substrate-binding protein